jgi:hypothetical protein
MGETWEPKTNNSCLHRHARNVITDTLAKCDLSLRIRRQTE